jgi:valyl-tRNA synthetase
LTPEDCSSCGSKRIRQDEDVLDTWFSSALWPFSTLGWPEKTDDLAAFYPTGVLTTDPDIIYLWVARMIVSGMEFMSEIPFPHVYIHSTVLTRDGKRMSRSLGTGVDPIEMMEKYGTDSVRFTLTSLETQSQSFRLWEKRCEIGRNFCNKLWNASRFILMNLKEDFAQADIPVSEDLELPDRWILSRLNRTIQTVNGCLERYSFHEAAAAAYDYFWHEYCDWYLELIKPRLSGENGATAMSISIHCLENTLRLLHPIMPFITEEIWQRLPHDPGSILMAGWPRRNVSLLDEAAELEFSLLKDSIAAIRNMRSEMNLSPQSPLKCTVSCNRGVDMELFGAHKECVKSLANLSELNPVENADRPEASASSVVRAGVTLFLHLGEMIDFEVEKKRLKKEISKIRAELAKTESQLADERFTSRAPADVVEAARKKKDGWLSKVSRLEETLKSIQEA